MLQWFLGNPRSNSWYFERTMQIGIRFVLPSCCRCERFELCQESWLFNNSLLCEFESKNFSWILRNSTSTIVLYGTLTPIEIQIVSVKFETFFFFLEISRVVIIRSKYQPIFAKLKPFSPNCYLFFAILLHMRFEGSTCNNDFEKYHENG